jgi:hypothetical protein
LPLGSAAQGCDFLKKLLNFYQSLSTERKKTALAFVEFLAQRYLSEKKSGL